MQLRTPDIPFHQNLLGRSKIQVMKILDFPGKLDNAFAASQVHIFDHQIIFSKSHVERDIANCQISASIFHCSVINLYDALNNWLCDLEIFNIGNICKVHIRPTFFKSHKRAVDNIFQIGNFKIRFKISFCNGIFQV